MTALGLWYYFRCEKDRLHKSSKEDAVNHIHIVEEPVTSAIGMPKIGGPFRLINHQGRAFDYPKDLNGAHSLIYFGFTHCPDICPEELDKISEAVKMVEAAHPKGKLQTLFITCDPQRDSPQAIADYLKGTKMLSRHSKSCLDFHPSIIGLTGDIDAVRETAKLFRVYYKAAKTSTTDPNDYLVDHTIFYYLMDPNGQYVTHFGRDHKAKDVAQSILEVLNK